MSIENMPDFTLNILSFHGTHESVARNIVAHKNFLIGDIRPDHWLGQGVYFYREDYKQALVWATYKIKGRKELHGENAAVVYTHIEVQKSQFLNLDTRDGLSYYKDFLKTINRTIKDTKLEIEVQEDKKKILLMCLYCDMLPENIKIIQRTYPVNSREFDSEEDLKEMGMHLHGTQVCVRDTSVIQYNTMGIYSTAPVIIVKRKKKSRKILFEKE
ncbi:hypothetical protein [Metabacillus fastidiosus]|uniref:hypothetical protein n=1 Tax=Metabacillus fastidiosus TaxID=1458 RepID=UPI003D2AAE4B